jgi:hypothetical protein
LGPKRAFAPARPPSSARGQVARGTFSGPRSRGTRCGPRAAAPSTPAKRTKSQDTANGTCARTPNHLPRHRRWRASWCRANCRCTGRWWCPRAEAPFAVSWLLARLACVDAANRCGPPCCPASVGRRTGVPPSPCGTVSGGLGRRGQLQPPALVRNLECAQRRTPASGRKRTSFPMQSNANGYESTQPADQSSRIAASKRCAITAPPRCWPSATLGTPAT